MGSAGRHSQQAWMKAPQLLYIHSVYAEPGVSQSVSLDHCIIGILQTSLSSEFVTCSGSQSQENLSYGARRNKNIKNCHLLGQAVDPSCPVSYITQWCRADIPRTESCRTKGLTPGGVWCFIGQLIFLQNSIYTLYRCNSLMTVLVKGQICSSVPAVLPLLTERFKNTICLLKGSHCYCLASYTTHFNSGGCLWVDKC